MKGLSAGMEASRQPVPPSQIELHRMSRTLNLTWRNDRVVMLHADLRAACRCANCENLRWREALDVTLSPDVEVMNIDLVAGQGLRFHFNDGHDRGINSWPYLYQLAFPSVAAVRSP